MVVFKFEWIKNCRFQKTRPTFSRISPLKIACTPIFLEKPALLRQISPKKASRGGKVVWDMHISPWVWLLVFSFSLKPYKYVYHGLNETIFCHFCARARWAACVCARTFRKSNQQHSLTCACARITQACTHTHARAPKHAKSGLIFVRPPGHTQSPSSLVFRKRDLLFNVSHR